MKKTLSIHLGRQLFVIEEDAYNRLHAYLQKLETSLANESGVSEIIEDIEMRFAELLYHYLGEHRKVVTITDVEQGIESLGEPEEISEESTQSSADQTHNSQSSTNNQKRLYRDTEKGTVAGICAGLSAYLQIDPVIVRVLFVIFGFMGFGFPLYIILWIVIPNANTPSERLQMRGKPVTVDTLKEEIERAAGRIKEESINASKKWTHNNRHIADRARGIVRIISRLFGILMISVALIWLTVFSMVITGVIDFFPMTGDQEYASLSEFLQLVAPANKSFNLVWIAILLVGFSGPLLAITIGSRILLGKASRFFTLNFILFPTLLAIGIVIGIIGGFHTARDYAVDRTVVKQEYTLNIDTLYVDELPTIRNNQRIVDEGGIDFISIERGHVIRQGISIKYLPSKDSLFHIYQRASAHGVDGESAERRCRNIVHHLKIEGEKVLIDPNYKFLAKDGLRDQEVEIVIEVPKSKQLYIKGIQQEVNQYEHEGYFHLNEPFDAWENETEYDFD